MNDDDLLITNSYSFGSNCNKSSPNMANMEYSYDSATDNITFKKLMESKNKVQTLYSENNPTFSQDQKIDRDLGIGIPETSVGLEQFINLGMLDKKRKIKKTVVSIDSRNRELNSVFDKQQLTVRRFNEFLSPELNKPLQYQYNSDSAFILLENNQIDTLENKQFIISSSDEKEFLKTNYTADDFIFNSSTSYPLLDIINYYYDPLINKYDPSNNIVYRLSNNINISSLEKPILDFQRKLYTFNVIQYKIPSKNNTKIIHNASIGGYNTVIQIVKNLKRGYPSTSHYKVNLGRNFSSIYGIRLLSTEIPNASYTFNGSSQVSDFGQFNLTTKVNNKLKWIYKNNNIEESNWNVIGGNVYLNNNPSNINYLLKPNNSQITNSLINIELYDISNNNYIDNKTDFIENQQRYQSLIHTDYNRLKENYQETYDYAFDSRYIGKLYEDGIQKNDMDIYYISDTLFTPLENILPFLNKQYGFYEYYLLNDPSGNTATCDISFNTSSYNYTMYISGTDPSQITFLDNLVNKYKYNDIVNPVLIKLVPFENVLYSYTFSLFEYDLSNNIYTLSLLPMQGTLDASGLSFLENSSNYKWLMVVMNEMTNEILMNIFNSNNYIYNHIKQYYIKTKSIPCPDISGGYVGTITKPLFNYNTINSVDYKFTNIFDGSGGTFTIDTSKNYIYISKYLSNLDDDTFDSYLKDYHYLRIDNVFFDIISRIDVSGSTLDSLFYIYEYNDTNYNPSNYFTDDTIYTINIQDAVDKQLVSIIFTDSSADNIQDKHSIMRLFLTDEPCQYVDLYIGNEISGNEYEIKYKYKTGLLNLYAIDYEYDMVLCEEVIKSYLRETIDNYMLIDFNNIADNLKEQYNLNAYYVDNSGNLVTNSSNIIFENMYLDKGAKEEYTDVYDIPRYNIVGLHRKNIGDGLIDSDYNQEYVIREPTDLYIQYPSIDNKTDKLITPYILDANDTLINGNLYKTRRYPVYNTEIKPGKYVESSLTKYFDTNLNSISKKSYDNSTDFFVERDILNRQTNLQNIYETGNSKFVIEMDRNINSLKISNFRKIYQTYSNSSIDNRRNIYVNEGFPYVCFSIPDIAVSNGSFIKIEGLSSVDNINSVELNKIHSVIVPKKFKTYVRQLLPLPKVDYNNNNKNLFAYNGSGDNSVNLVNNLNDYINSAIKKDNVKDLKIDFIVSTIFGLGEAGYNNIRNLGNKNIQGMQTDINKNYISSYGHQFKLDELKRSFLNNKGINENYESVNGFNGRTTRVVTRNNNGVEYIGTAPINGAKNGILYNELETDPQVFVKDGLETTFLTNELIIRLEDLYDRNIARLIGRITYNSKYTDDNGNIEMNYDLFTEFGNNFKVGDIIIGLDSMSIGIILPYDFNFNALPNTDMKLLGIGSYILNNQMGNLNSFFDKFYSLDSVIDTNDRKSLAKLFLTKLNTWQIKENKTHQNFYIQTNSIPNTSRLSGVLTSNLSIYVPEFFRFIKDEESPLDLFGFVDDYYNNSFSYFKDNSTPFESLLIERSFLKKFNNRDVYLILETKQVGDISVGDKIYIEDHDIIYSKLESRRNKHFSVELFESFASYIAKMESIYNCNILNYNTINRIADTKDVYINGIRVENDKDYFYDLKYSVNVSNELVPIPFKNIDIARKLDQNINQYVYNYNLICVDSSNNILDNQFYLDLSGDNILGILLGNNENLLSSQYVDVSQVYHLTICDKYNNRNLYIKPIYDTIFYAEKLEIDIVDTVQYYIKLNIVRCPYVILDKEIDISGQYVLKYDTLGIFERLLENYINSFYSKYNYDINKANYLNNMYNYSLYKNRIMKIKVCPVDDLGFSYEPYDASNNQASATDYTNRQIKGYYKKLFPYHEKKYLKNYYYLEEGQNIVPNSVNQQGYGRIMQDKSINDFDSKQFLPGMGVYIIENETISTQASNSKFPASFYKYDTTFIGYVLDTSVDEQAEYYRDYTLMNDNFSKVPSEQSIYSEYYIYVLIDPDISSKKEIELIFDKLNKDYTHIVFDASADTDYTTNYLEIEGFTTEKKKYSYSVSDISNNITLTMNTNTTSSSIIGTNDYVYIINQNKAGINSVFTSSQVQYYENFDGNTSIASSNVDAFSELTLSWIGISKPKLNKTLPYYNFQFRKACATITSRPVLYSSEPTSTTPEKLFISGDLDYFYKNYLKNKTIMNYKPLWEDTDLQYINNMQLIVDNPISTNYRPNNEKERDAHSNYLDNNYNSNTDYYETNSYNSAFKNELNTITPILSFEPGDDFIIFETDKQLNSYSSGKTYNSLERSANGTIIKNDVNLKKNSINVLSGGILPSINFPHTNIVGNNWNNMVKNVALIDYNYDTSLEKLTYSSFLGKVNGYNIDIVGNNSDLYKKIDIDETMSFYNTVEITKITQEYFDRFNEYFTEIIEISAIFKGSNRIFVDISNNNPENEIFYKDLKDCIFITYSRYYTQDYTFPLDEPLQSEIAIINNVEYIPSPDNNPLNATVKITFSNYLKYLNSDITVSGSKYEIFNLHSIPYRIIKTQDAVSNIIADKYYYNVNSSLQNEPSSLCYKDGKWYIVVSDENKYIEKGDYIIIDYGKVANVEYDNMGKTPYKMYFNENEKTTKKETMTYERVIDIIQLNNNIRAIEIKNPIVSYWKDSIIIILKDPFIKTGSDSYLIERNNLATQSFTVNNKWYTKIFYNGSNFYDGTHINASGKTTSMFNINTNTNIGGNPKYSRYESKNIFVSGMRGIKLPYIDISKKTFKYSTIGLLGDNGDIRFYIEPMNSGYYTTMPHIIEDFQPYLTIDGRNMNINGKFMEFEDKIYNNDLIQTSLNDNSQWININNGTENEYEYPYVVVEGLFLGYGGTIQERYDRDITNTILNNDIGFFVNRVLEVNGNQLVYFKIPPIYQNFFNYDDNLTQNQNKFRSRNDDLPINIQFKILDTRIKQSSEVQNEWQYIVQNGLEFFGNGGRLVKKKIQTPYSLNPNNYIYLSIPNLNHIKPLQNNEVSDAFAKILLPGESNRVLFNTYVGGSKIYYDGLFNNLNELEIAFLTNDGYMFDFNGSENSFTLEITELIDKFEYIDPKFGNIEI